MPNFSELLSEDDVDDIQAYLIDKANQDHELRNNPGWLIALKKWCYDIIAWVVATFLNAYAAST